MQTISYKLLVLGCLLTCLACTSQNQAPTEEEVASSAPINYLEESSADKDARMTWWREARFGMFIHWGPSAVLGGEWKGEKSKGFGEWIMDHKQIPIEEYESLSQQFNPIKFDAKEWVGIAKAAGMKYIVFTTKHHDGFALWDSEYNDWDMGGTPFQRDILKELQMACAAADIKLGFYHSIMDWHNMDAQGQFYPDYNVFPNDDSLRASTTKQKYIEEKMKPQLKELLTNYGDIGVVWFDGEWVNSYTTEMGKDIYQFVRELQPNTIVNNRVDRGRSAGKNGISGEGFFAGDFGTPEQEIPETGLPGIDWETCQTLNDSWGYRYFDDNWKSDSTMIFQLVDIASKGGNLLLNVGPTGEGIIPAPSVAVLKAMGKWLEVNGESIYGTTASPIEAPEWGRITKKGDALYLHVFDWPKDGKVELEIEGSFQKAMLVATKELIDIKKTEKSLQLKLPKVAPDPICSVIKIK